MLSHAVGCRLLIDILFTWFQLLHGVRGKMATYQISPPERFTFQHPDNWPKWIRRFERFRQASGLNGKEEQSQVNRLIYTMGDEADDILSSFGLTEEQKREYATVKDRFEKYFVKKRNPIFERAKFNSRVQREGESVDSFITSLHSLSEHCDYGAPMDEMIRDRIVVGILNSSLSEKSLWRKQSPKYVRAKQ